MIPGLGSLPFVFRIHSRRSYRKATKWTSNSIGWNEAQAHYNDMVLMMPNAQSTSTADTEKNTRRGCRQEEWWVDSDSTTKAFMQVLCRSIIELIVGTERRSFLIHRAVIDPYVSCIANKLAQDSLPNVIELPDEFPFSVAAIIEYLYVGDRWTPPFSNPFFDKMNLPTKLALAEIFLLSERWNLTFVSRACTDALATIHPSCTRSTEILEICLQQDSTR